MPQARPIPRLLRQALLLALTSAIAGATVAGSAPPVRKAEPMLAGRVIPPAKSPSWRR